LSAEEDAELHTMARSIVVKGVESPERLLDETALFLHRIVTDLPPEKQRMLERLNSSDEDLVGRTVLLVDDDARNIFALSSVLERRGMRVLTATTGNEAIALAESTPDLAIVLMDIMMPEMDGYQTIRAIRERPGFRRLPIVALTAKAMKGNRENCLEAEASADLAENLIKAASAREALEQLLKHEIAVILVDVCMPELDGFQLAAMIRDHPRFQKTAIIFISAIHLTDVDRLRAYEMGAVDYVP